MEIYNEIEQLYKSQEFDEVISTAFTICERTEDLPIEIKKLVALSYYHKKDYVFSLNLWQNIAADSDDVVSWFNVLSSHMALKQTVQGEEVFNKILKIHKGVKTTGNGEDFVPQLSIPFIRYYYACMLNDAGLNEGALKQLQELVKLYCEIKITDDTFLVIRGVPPMGNTLELAKKVFAGLNSDISCSDMIKELKSNVDRNGKKLIKKYLK